jgi:hypothetical protein
MHCVLLPFGPVPGGHALQETPSSLISLGPQASQNVLWSLNVHLLPGWQGLLKQVATAAPKAETALECSFVGSSMLEFVMRALSVELNRRVAPPGASLSVNTQSRIVTKFDPAASTAPPRPTLTRNCVDDHITSLIGQQRGPVQARAWTHPGNRSPR